MQCRQITALSEIGERTMPEIMTHVDEKADGEGIVNQRKPYAKPSIIYELALVARAGSPIDIDPLAPEFEK